MRSSLGAIQGLRSVKRAQEILRILVRNGFHQLVEELELDRAFGRGMRWLGVAPDQEIAREPVPVRVRRMIEELGPTFIKVGQILSTRPDLVPEEWVVELRKLQSDIPAAEWSRIETLLAEEFPHGTETVFRSIEHEALAAASIAQVHRAVLLDGEEIVLKVLRPGIRDVVDADMEIMRLLASLLESRLKNTGYSPTAVVEQFWRELERELDLTIEAQSTERMSRDFESDPAILFPRIHWGATTRNVLAMEEIHGTLLSRLDVTTLAPEARRRIVEHGASAVFRQCLSIGFFHADPHPGNIFVLEGERICFIDCGMTGHLDPTTAELLADLVHGAITADLDRVVRVAIVLADADPALAHERKLRVDVWRFIDRFRAASLNDLRMGDLLGAFFELLREHHMQCPADLVHLIKAIGTIEGVAQSIAPEFDVVAFARPHVERLVRRRYGVAATRRRIQGSLLAYTKLFQELPDQVQELLRSIQQKRLALNIEHKGLDALTSALDRASVTVSYALLVAALIVGSSVLLLAERLHATHTWLSWLAGLGYVSSVVLVLFRLVGMHFSRRR